MDECCIKSIVTQGFRDNFRLAEEGEGFTCGACGSIYRVVNGQWTKTESATTVNVIDADIDVIDMGWARAIRNRADKQLLVQCWGCGQALVMPDRPYNQHHFPHAPGCRLAKAIVNKSKGKMPVPAAH